MKVIICTEFTTINGENKSWIEFWEQANDQTASCCSELECCENRNLVGVHVQIVNSNKQIYVVPLCHNHFNLTTEIELFHSVKLIPIKN